METIYEGINLKKKNIYIYTEKVTLIFSFFSPTFLAFKAVRL